MAWWFATSAIQSRIFRWSDWFGSYSRYGINSNWEFDQLRRLPAISLSIVDDIVWKLVTAFESVALGSMLVFFFVFCGCTI